MRRPSVPENGSQKANMKNRHVIPEFFAILLALVAQSAGGPVKPPVPVSCIMTLTVSRADCPWQGMTDSYDQEQSNKFVQAGAFDGGTNGALPSLAEFDRPDVLMIRDSAQKIVAVNSNYFSDLRRGDATRLGMGQPHRIGEFRDLTFHRLNPRDLVLFLIQSQVIETYWHLEAKIWFLRDKDSPETYQAWFHGVHTYYTNEQNDDAFSFVVAIDKRTGEMILTGGDLFDVRGPQDQ